MVQRKIRVPIPSDVANDVLFRSDLTCCVCRVAGKHVQIHHINDDPSDNQILNLAVLCLECHARTQISGGFGRRLNAELVILYRDDWLNQIATRRTAKSLIENSVPPEIRVLVPDASAGDTRTRVAESARQDQGILLSTKFEEQKRRMLQLADTLNALTDISNEYIGALNRATMKTRIAKDRSEIARSTEELADELVQVVTRYSIQADACHRLDSEINRGFRDILGIIKKVPRGQWQDSWPSWLQSTKNTTQKRLKAMESLQSAYDSTSTLKGKSRRLDSILQHKLESDSQILSSRESCGNLFQELDALSV